MANAAGIFHRYLMILQYIPRYPASITTPVLLSRLEVHGIQLHLKGDLGENKATSRANKSDEVFISSQIEMFYDFFLGFFIFVSKFFIHDSRRGCTISRSVPISTVFLRSLMPLIMVRADLGNFHSSASNLSSALLALPASGTAVTEALRTALAISFKR